MAQFERFRFLRYGMLTVGTVLLLAALTDSILSFQMRRQIARGVFARAIQSVETQKKLGEPIRMGYFVRGRVIGRMDAGTADLAIPVSGPAGTGMLRDWSQNGFAGWQVCSLEFRSDDGSRVVIVADEETHCERE
jgi:hypothetical protein